MATIETNTSTTKSSEFTGKPVEDVILRILGIALIALGVGLLLYLIFQIPALIDNLSENPIHQYIVSFDPEKRPIKFGDTVITFPKEYLHIVAFVMMAILLQVWVAICTSIISCGKTLVGKDKEMNKLVETLDRYYDSLTQKRL